MKIKRSLLLVALIWLIFIGYSLAWNYQKAQENHEQIALHASRSLFQQIVITRQWNARHGGIYIPITADTQPNPLLESKDRDIAVSPSLKLTKINPAFMTRQIAEIAMEQEGIQFHITSLAPIRPENRATPAEQEALQQFEEGVKEVGYFTRHHNESFYFYMAPLETGKACLQCHAQQGYGEGDIRGGISVTLPLPGGAPMRPLFVGHLAIALVGLLGIATYGLRLDKAYQTIKRQAIFDALTGIPNRRSFSESILRECDRCRRSQEPLSLILCDIDFFKAYNDTYGHSKGDLCLQMVAKAIEGAVNRPGDFCARYGGEEFVVILTDTNLEGATEVAERIRQAVVDLAITHKNSPPLELVSLSLGVACSEETDHISHEDLIRFADRALYAAKEKGRNRVEVFHDI